MFNRLTLCLGFAVAAAGLAVNPVSAQHYGHSHGSMYGSSSVSGGHYGGSYSNSGHIHAGHGLGGYSGYSSGSSMYGSPTVIVPSYPIAPSSYYRPVTPVVPRPPVWHDTTHLDYHAGTFVPHGGHSHYVPGHYDVHHTGHLHY